MVEPVTGGLIAGGLLSAAGGVLGAAADLHGLGATRLLRGLIDRFEAAPDESPVFYAAIWRAAVRATHGCVQQVYEHTGTSDDVRGDTPSWDRFREAHVRVRKVREWSDAPTLPQALQHALTRDLAHTLRAQTQPDDAGPSSAARAVWASYCSALRDAGMQGEPPTVIHQAFFGERTEAKVLSWSRHFALRIGEQLRDDAGFKAMFDAEQFAWIGTGVARLIKEFTAVEQMLAEMSAKLDAVHGIAERTEQNTLQLRSDNQQMMDVLRDIQSRLPAGAIGLSEEIERLRQRPDISLEDLVGWLQTALNRNHQPRPDELPRLLQQALTVDLPKLRAEADRYRLDRLASPEVQAMLGEVRALLHPQAGRPLDLQAASDKIKALDDRVVTERAARRRGEDNDLAQLRVLRAEAERAMLHYAAAAELMEQAVGLSEDEAQARVWNKQAADDWFNHGELHPGVEALESAIRLLCVLVVTSATSADSAFLHSELGRAAKELGNRLEGDAGLQLLRAAEVSYRTTLAACTRDEMPVAWAVTQNNLGGAQFSLSERLVAEAGLQALRAAEASFRAALGVITNADMQEFLATIHSNLGQVQSSLGERLGGEAGLQALHAAEVSFRGALEVHTRTDRPTAWAMTQSGLGTVQARLGERLGGDTGLRALRAAEASFRAALEIYTRAEMPVHWAKNQDNLGTVQHMLGKRLDGEAGLQVLRAAVTCHRAALEVRTRHEMPMDWARTQNNLGNALDTLGTRLDGEAGLQTLRAAELSYRAALEVYTRDEAPVGWATTQNNLGTVQLSLSIRLDGEASLQSLRAAETSYRAALEVRTRAEMPVDWATTQNNLGLVQVRLGQRLGGEAGLQALRAAEASICAALEVYERVSMPLDWAKTQNDLGFLQTILYQRLDGSAALDALQAAATNYMAALEVRTRAHMPVDWAITQNELGNLQMALGQRLNGDTGLQALQMAKASYRAALEVFTRETMPAYWNGVTGNLNMVEKLLAERGG